MAARDLAQDVLDGVQRKLRRWKPAGLFFRNFLRHPVMLGSAIPSSRFLISRVLDRVDWSQTRLVIEYGPGVGTFTREILKRMPADAELVAIELNEDFVEFLRWSICDPRLRLVHGSAADVGRILRRYQLPAASCIISGIPYTLLPRKLRQAILKESRKVLDRHGVFMLFQYTRAVLPDLRRVFGHIDQEFELLNILPARLFFCSK